MVHHGLHRWTTLVRRDVVFVDVKTCNVAMSALQLASQWQRGLMLVKDAAGMLDYIWMI